jgi:hypothetical protein
MLAACVPLCLGEGRRVGKCGKGVERRRGIGEGKQGTATGEREDVHIRRVRLPVARVRSEHVRLWVDELIERSGADGGGGVGGIQVRIQVVQQLRPVRLGGGGGGRGGGGGNVEVDDH